MTLTLTLRQNKINNININNIYIILCLYYFHVFYEDMFLLLYISYSLFSVHLLVRFPKVKEQKPLVQSTS